ncbi:unnamed protein product [Ectocarpus sp. 6 AP-2014]
MTRAMALPTGSEFSALAVVDRSLCLWLVEELRLLRMGASSVYFREVALFLERPRTALEPALPRSPSGKRARPELLLPPPIE